MIAVQLEDESLRDGLQLESKVLSLDEKYELFLSLVRAGLARIQIGSFVNPQIVPQMADTEELVKMIGRSDEVLVSGLVLNGRGLERALDCGLQHISLSASVSDAHSRKNVRRPYLEALETTSQLIKEAAAAKIKVRAGIQCSFGCVYEGQIAHARVFDALEKMAAAGAVEFNLADTAGMANPLQVGELAKEAIRRFPELAPSLHLHDTRGFAIANMVAGYQAGVRIFDTSAGGLGGCPFVKGAAGNIATEDAANLFHSMGIATGLDLEKLCATVSLYQALLGRPLPGRFCRLLAAKGKGPAS